MTPFNYPASPHVLRHYPQGYTSISSYRLWLRDEYKFRCVFCLVREQWGRVTGLYDLDHFHPVSRYPDQEFNFENLLYTCARCNHAKGTKLIPDPRQVLVASAVSVNADGELEVTSSEARQIIRRLRLDDRESVEFRRMWVRIIAMAEVHDFTLYCRLMGFPEDLPNLNKLRPPNGNRLPEGVRYSFHARKVMGTLDSYCD